MAKTPPVKRETVHSWATDYAVKHEVEPKQLYTKILEWAKSMSVDDSVTVVIEAAVTEPPSDYLHHQR